VTSTSRVYAGLYLGHRSGTVNRHKQIHDHYGSTRTDVYLTDYCVPVDDISGHLRSAVVHQLTVPRVRRNKFGSRVFVFAGPTVWNSLPEYLLNQLFGTIGLDVT